MTDKREKNDLVTKNFEAFPDVAADILLMHCCIMEKML